MDPTTCDRAFIGLQSVKGSHTTGQDYHKGVVHLCFVWICFREYATGPNNSHPKSLRGLHTFKMTFFATCLNRSTPSIGLVQVTS